MRRLSGLTFLVVGLLAAGCQDQAFEELVPGAVSSGTQRVVVAQPVALDIMLVVDSSGSMTQPAFTGGVLSKWDELKTALLEPQTGFIAANSQNARFALTSFPTGPLCDAGRQLVEMGGVDGANFNRIASALQAIRPEGGTPTTPTLANITLDDFGPVQGRRPVVVLLTDGLPNCNPANADLCRRCNEDPATCSEPDGCRPTFDTDSVCVDVMIGLPQGSDCFDDRNLVREVERLADEGIETVVIGFGVPAEDTAQARLVLNSVAAAGGWARAGDQAFYEARSAEELRDALEASILPASCTWALESAPPEDGVISVVAVEEDGQEQLLEQGRDWSFRSADRRELAVAAERCGVLRQEGTVRELQVRWAAPLE